MSEVVKRPVDHPRINAAEVALQYAKDVLSGRIVAGKLVILAAKRFLLDLQNGSQRGLMLVADRAQNVVDFFGFLKHTKGEWGGTTFILAPWQVFVLVNLFGWYNADGTRRFHEAHIEVARKNGKTTFLAGMALYMLLVDGEPGAEVYSAATKKDQAKIVFDEACNMRHKSPFLAARIQASRNNLSVLASSSKFEPLSSDFNTLDGLNVHFAAIDELHAHPDRKLYDVLKEAMAARRNPLAMAITTAGYDRNGICYKQREVCEKILVGAVSVSKDSDSIFAYIACIDEPDDDGKNGDDPFNEACWIKANPSLGITVKLDFLRTACFKAKEDPTSLNSFLRKHLDVWTSQDVRWMPIDKWAACNSAGPLVDLKTVLRAAREKLKGRACFGGLDLSSKIDITALALVFPPLPGQTEKKLKAGAQGTPKHLLTEADYEDVVMREADPQTHILTWFWVPEQTVPERVKKDRVPYDVWVREGFLQTTPGNVVDQAYIRKTLGELRKEYQIEEVAFDSWNATQLSLELAEDGFKMVEARQGYKTLSEPMKELMALVVSRKLEHYGHPVLTWMAGNVAAEQDPAGNIKPDKEHSKEKIDGIVATIMAQSRIIANPNIGQSSVYSSRGIVFI